ncbi:MAG TPA: CvpA family protein [Rhodanobacteraceae bacterium]
MNWADYVIIAILALSVLMGLWRGLIAEVMALIVWIAAFWVAWLLGPRLAQAFAAFIDVPSVRVILGYVVCFVAVLLVGMLLKFIIDRLVEGTGLSGSDRLLGMVFGLLRGAILVTLLVFLLGFTPFTRDPWWHRSQLLPTFVTAANWMGQQLPDSVHRYLHPQPTLLPHVDVNRAGAALHEAGSHVAAGLQKALAPAARPAAAQSTSGASPARVARMPLSSDN